MSRRSAFALLPLAAPYMVIMGDREAADRTLSTRLRDGTEMKDVALADFIVRLKEESRVPEPGRQP